LFKSNNNNENCNKRRKIGGSPRGNDNGKNLATSLSPSCVEEFYTFFELQRFGRQRGISLQIHHKSMIFKPSNLWILLPSQAP
jgi:hypothetical protein